MKNIKGKKAISPQPQTTTVDWNEVHRRLEAAQATLERGWTPSAEEKKKILRERAFTIAQVREEEPTAGEIIEIVEFQLSNERYGVESLYVREVYPLKELIPLPCTPPFLLGVVNVHGRIISIIDIRKFFDLPEEGLTDINNIIIVGNDRMELAILTDAITGMRSIPLQGIQPSLPTLTGIRAEYLKGFNKCGQLCNNNNTLTRYTNKGRKSQYYEQQETREIHTLRNSDI